MIHFKYVSPSVNALLNSGNPDDILLGLELSKSFFNDSNSWITHAWSPVYFNLRTLLSGNRADPDIYSIVANTSFYDK